MIYCKIDIEENSECKKCCKDCKSLCNKKCVFLKTNLECDNKVDGTINLKYNDDTIQCISIEQRKYTLSKEENERDK